jgi:branched-chain amino acid transport system permease protein
MSYVQLLTNTVALGAAYSLVALGFILVVKATGAVNFAHGDLVMAGGYVAILLGALLPLPLIVLLPLVAAAMFAAGVVLCFLAYMPLIKRPPSTVFISTLLCGIILENAYVVAFGPQAKAGPPLLATGSLSLGEIDFSIQGIGTLTVAALLVATQYLLFFHTQLGKRLRAVAEDRDMARAVGIPAFRLIAVTFGVGTALAGIAGAILANQFFVAPTGGVALSVYGYIAVVIGGWGSLPGAVVGSMIVALFQVVASRFLPYTVAAGALYAALFVILFFRPQGVFGERIQRRV